MNVSISQNTAISAERHLLSQAREAARPVVFADTVGLFQPSVLSTPQKLAVLFLAPWSFEEIAMRRIWRMLAEQLAEEGIASLRFDYPGTGDALDQSDEVIDLDLWRSSVIAACKLLKQLSGATQVVLVGQGLGAAIAYDVSLQIPAIAGVGLLAPVISGRAYARETSAWSRMTEGKTASAHSDLPVLGGEVVAKRLFASIGAIDLIRGAVPPVENYFVAARKDRPAELALHQHLNAHGKAVDLHAYDGYAEMLNNLTLSKPPTALMAKLVQWVKGLAQSQHSGSVVEAGVVPAKSLCGAHFSETPVRLGDNHSLHGILCEPLGRQAQQASVLLLNTSYERAAGWGRGMTNLARQLASSGIASVRFDAANVGDSPPAPGAPDQVIYSETQLADVDAALEFLGQRKPGPVILAGRCSGGYTAFRSLLRHEQLAGAVVANAHMLRWDPNQSLEELLLFVPQPLNAYRSKAFRVGSWKKILSGKVNLKRGIINISGLLRMRLLGVLRPVLEQLSLLPNEHRLAHHDLKTVYQRGAGLSFIFSEGDIGLNYFYQHFDVDDGRLRLYPDARFTIAKGADHNLLTPEARAIFRNEIERLVMEAGKASDAAQAR